MASQWEIVISAAPETVSYNEIVERSELDQEDGEHTYLTEEFLTPKHSIPGIPSQYANDQVEGRALYLCAPKIWQDAVIRSIFQLYGTVEKLPVLISLSAEQTFRWVVMASNAEAVMAMERLHGRKVDGGFFMAISMSLPPGRTLTLVKKELFLHQPVFELVEEEEVEDPDQTPTQELYHGHPPFFHTSHHQKTPTVSTFEFRVEDTDACHEDTGSAEVLYGLSAEEVNRALALQSELYDDIDPESNSTENIETPELHQPTKFSPLNSPVKPPPPEEPAPAPVSSWASITASANPETKVVDLKPEQKGYRLKPVGRIPSVTKTDLNDNARLVFLFDLPSTITYADVSNAIVEGPLVKMRFGIDVNTQKRYCGVVFQHSHDATAFQKSLDEEKRLSQPKRFRFIVDHARDVQDGLDTILKAMGPPTWATRRLTIVKAGFFFIFGERQLRDVCNKLVGEETVQLIWLYNGGNATVVFTDVSAAIKVKNEFDRRAERAQMGAEGAYTIWAGLITTYSKDPCIVPLELKTQLLT